MARREEENTFYLMVRKRKHIRWDIFFPVGFVNVLNILVVDTDDRQVELLHPQHAPHELHRPAERRPPEGHGSLQISKHQTHLRNAGPAPDSRGQEPPGGREQEEAPREPRRPEASQPEVPGVGGRGAHGGPGRARRRGPRGGGGLAAQALRRACCSGTAPPPPGKWNSSAAVPCRVGPPGTDGQSVSRVFRPPRAGTRCFRRLRSVPAPPAGRLRFPGQRRQRASESLSRTLFMKMKGSSLAEQTV